MLDRATWRPPAIFALLAARGGIGGDEMERVFNMGMGMAAVVSHADADRALSTLTERGVPAWPAGEVIDGTEGANLVGSYRT